MWMLSAVRVNAQYCKDSFFKLPLKNCKNTSSTHIIFKEKHCCYRFIIVTTSSAGRYTSDLFCVPFLFLDSINLSRTFTVSAASVSCAWLLQMHFSWSISPFLLEANGQLLNWTNKRLKCMTRGTWQKFPIIRGWACPALGILSGKTKKAAHTVKNKKAVPHVIIANLILQIFLSRVKLFISESDNSNKHFLGFGSKLWTVSLVRFKIMGKWCWCEHLNCWTTYHHKQHYMDKRIGTPDRYTKKRL